jgi:hypothetical protein
MIKEKIKNMSLVSFVKIPKDAEYPMKQAVSESLQLINYSFDKSIRKVVIKPNLCIIGIAQLVKRLSPDLCLN